MLDKVGSERKFGLLSCDHAFCLGCIRNWRNNTTGGVDIDAVRAIMMLLVIIHVDMDFIRFILNTGPENVSSL